MSFLTDKGDSNRQAEIIVKCIYTAQIEAWTVDDWTRVRAIHLNHHLIGDCDLMSYLSYIEMIEHFV